MVATPLEMTGSILSVKMSSSEKMCELAEFSNMTFKTSYSNQTCSEYSTLEEIMWHILSFEIVHKTKVLFLVWRLGGGFPAFQLGLLEFVFSFIVLYFSS